MADESHIASDLQGLFEARSSGGDFLTAQKIDDAVGLCLSGGLGARICELREDGWQIRTEETTNGECYYHLIAPPPARQLSLV